jgi:hypothetical protein
VAVLAERQRVVVADGGHLIVGAPERVADPRSPGLRSASPFVCGGA